MQRGLRVTYLLAVALSLAILPIGNAAVILALFLALDLAAAARLLRRPAQLPPDVVPLGDAASVALLRRTVPQLRSRRPAAIIEAQVAWRQAAEFRRRQRFPLRRPG